MTILCSALWEILTWGNSVSNIIGLYNISPQPLVLHCLCCFLQYHLSLLLSVNVLSFVKAISNPINVNFLLKLNITPGVWCEGVSVK